MEKTKEELCLEMEEKRRKVYETSMEDVMKWRKVWREYIRIRDEYILKGGCLI